MRVPCLLGFVVFTASLVFSQQFQNPTYYPDPGAQFVAAADFNKDGLPDFVDFGGFAQATVFLNQGSGSFAMASTFTVPSIIYALSTADMNGDGNPDLLLLAKVNSSVWTLTVYLGNGKGAFGQRPSHEVTPIPQALTVADFNGDGNLDVAVAGNAKGVQVFLGDGKGGLGKPTNYRGTTQSVAIASGDLNGDGHPDLVVAGSPGNLVVLLNNGDGTFSNGTGIKISSLPRKVLLADINHDGKLDAVVAAGIPGEIDVVLGNGDGTFGSVASYSTSVLGSGAVWDVAVADFNLDGNLDVVCTTFNGDFGILYGNGDGTLQNPIGVPIGGDFGWHLSVADFNLDGAPDLVVSTSSNTSQQDGVFLNAQ